MVKQETGMFYYSLEETMFCFMRAWTRSLFVRLVEPILLFKIKEGKKEGTEGGRERVKEGGINLKSSFWFDSATQMKT